MRQAKALIRLRVCAGWSEPLLVATHQIVGNLMPRLNYVELASCSHLVPPSHAAMFLLHPRKMNGPGKNF